MYVYIICRYKIEQYFTIFLNFSKIVKRYGGKCKNKSLFEIAFRIQCFIVDFQSKKFNKPPANCVISQLFKIDITYVEFNVT